MTIGGSDKYTYELIQDGPKLPSGEAIGVVSTVATDSKDRVYAFQRQDPPVMVFDRDGNYLNRWGIGAITDPHGMTIVDDVLYITDRSDHVAVKFTLDGKADEGADCTCPRSRQSTPTFNSVTPDSFGSGFLERWIASPPHQQKVQWAR